MNARIARKAIRFAAMLATRPIDADAPLLAASKMFCSSLDEKKKAFKSGEADQKQE